MLDIKIQKTDSPRQKPQGDLGFGRIFTDHMFLMNYSEGTGWFDARIVPYQEISLSPASAVFHYAQETFEGMKAYLDQDGERVHLFRPEKNARRLNRSNERMCIPPIPEDAYLQAVSELVKLDRAWVPREPGTSLYIRPFVIATEDFLGVNPSQNFLFIIIMSPSGLYYKDGLKPVSIWVEDSYVRAVPGGVGCAKTGGNYAASLLAQREAMAAGYDQVLWLDGLQQRYIEEVGSMNVFFKIDGELVTPTLNGSILPGITRDSVIELCRLWGYMVREEQLSIEDLLAAHKEGKLEEAFGTGTAAAISSIAKIRYQETDYLIEQDSQLGSCVEAGSLSKKLYDSLTGIQSGNLEDPFSWRVSI